MTSRRGERRRKRGGGHVRGDSAFLNPPSASQANGIEQVLCDAPTPELAASFAEECGKLIESLDDDRLQGIAIAKLEGYTNVELADRYDCAVSTIERALRLIRKKWHGRQNMIHGRDQDASLPIAAIELIDRIALDFETACRENRRPVIARYLEGFEGNERTELFRELLLVELEYRRHAGETAGCGSLYTGLPAAWSGRAVRVSTRTGSTRGIGRKVPRRDQKLVDFDATRQRLDRHQF